MRIEDQFRVNVPIERAWAVLLDVERIAPCLPGAQLQEIEGDEFRGVVKVKVGPITAAYQGTAKLDAVDEAARTIRIRGVGRDTRGAGNATAIINVGMHEVAGVTEVLVLPSALAYENPSAAVDRARQRSGRIAKLWCDGGFKRTFIEHCRHHHISTEVVTKIAPTGFEVLPRRWVIERTWSWLMNHRRLQIDYERDPVVHAGFIWAAHSRLLLRRLTHPAPT